MTKFSKFNSVEKTLNGAWHLCSSKIKQKCDRNWWFWKQIFKKMNWDWTWLIIFLDLWGNKSISLVIPPFGQFQFFDILNFISYFYFVVSLMFFFLKCFCLHPQLWVSELVSAFSFRLFSQFRVSRIVSVCFLCFPDCVFSILNSFNVFQCVSCVFLFLSGCILNLDF